MYVTREGAEPRSSNHDHTVAVKNGTLTLSATLPTSLLYTLTLKSKKNNIRFQQDADSFHSHQIVMHFLEALCTQRLGLLQ